MTEEEESNVDDQTSPWYIKHQTWIQENIKQRKCFVFSSESGEEEDTCCICQYEKEDHEIKDGNKKWKKEINTKTEASLHYGTALVKDPQESSEGTNSDADGEEGSSQYGDKTETEIEVDSQDDTVVDTEHKVQFIRVDEDTPMELVKHLLFEVWNLTKPKWIFSLLGTKKDKEDIWNGLEDAFDKLSTTSDLWLISDGLHNGVSEYIHAAKTNTYVTDRVTSIGCFAWGDLWEKSSLEEVAETKQKHVDYILDEDGFDLMGKTTSHFILVDNGTMESFLCYLSNISFYAKLMASLAASDDASSAIPAVAILHGGDELIILEGVKNLIKENVPVVIVKHSGGIADVMSRAFEESKSVSQTSADDSRSSGHVTVIDQRGKRRIKKDLARRFPIEKNVDESLQVIVQCMQRRDLITVVDLSGDETLFHGIISAIVKTKSNADLIALVDEYLPTPAYSRKPKEKVAKHVEKQKGIATYIDTDDSEMIICEIFKTALLCEKTECVELILETEGVDVNGFHIEDLFLKSKYDLQKTVFMKWKEMQDEFKVKQALEEIMADITRENVFKRLYGFLKKCRALVDSEEYQKETKVDILKHNNTCFQEEKTISSNSKGMKKRVAKIVREKKGKAALSKEITIILQACQKEFDVTVMADKEWENNDDSNSDSDSDSESDKQKTQGAIKKELTDIRLSSSKTKTQDKIEDEDEEAEPNTSDALILAFIKRVIRRFIPESCIEEGGSTTDEETSMEQEDYKTKEAYRKLFLWAVLTNRRDLARVFWKRGQDLIVTALVAGTIMDKIADTTFSSKRKAVGQESSKLYKQQCVGTIDACYLSDKKKTVMLLDRNTKKNIWNVDFLALAFEKQNNSVFQSDGLIYYTYTKWMGDIPKDTSTWRIVVCTLCPFLIRLLIGKFITKMEKKSKSSSETTTVDASLKEGARSQDQAYQANEEQADNQAKTKKYRNNLLFIECTKRLMKAMGILANTLLKRAVSCAAVVGLTCMSFSLLWISSHRKKKDTQPSLLTRFFTRFGNFYSTPIVKYILSLVIYLVFLGLYAHFMLVVLTFEFKWNWEISLLIWVAAFSLEELFQVLKFALQSMEQSKTKRRSKDPDKNCIERVLSTVSKYGGIYFQDGWNFLDICCVIGFIIGYPLRWFEVTYSYGRLFLSINFMCFFWRLLQACTPSKTIGPMLYMVFRMVTDLVPFLVILFVAIFSYAVASEAILYPNSVWSWSFLFAIPRKAFWQIFGEFYLDEIEGDMCTDPPCPSEIGKTLVPFILAAYIIMTNILLLNILIARFNHIFEDVRDKANEVWAWQKCRLMIEYESKPPFPLPFTIIWRTATFMKWLFRKCKKSKAVAQMPEKDKGGVDGQADSQTQATSEDEETDEPTEHATPDGDEEIDEPTEHATPDGGKDDMANEGEGADNVSGLSVEPEDGTVVGDVNTGDEERNLDSKETGDDEETDDPTEHATPDGDGAEDRKSDTNEDQDTATVPGGDNKDDDQTKNEEDAGGADTEPMEGEVGDVNTGDEERNLDSEETGDDEETDDPTEHATPDGDGAEDRKSDTNEDQDTATVPGGDNKDDDQTKNEEDAGGADAEPIEGEEIKEEEWDEWKDSSEIEESASEGYDFYLDSDDSDDSYYEEDESDKEDPLDVFERQNAEYYLQTEKFKK